MSRVDHYSCLDRRLVCQNERFDVFFDRVQLPSGEVIPDFLIVRPKVCTIEKVVGVCVVPVREGFVGLMRGYRHQLDEEVWQAPAGFVESGESAEQSALRELEEETQMTVSADELMPLGLHVPDAGLIEGKIALFVACGAQACGDVEERHKEAGTGELHWFDPKELRRLLTSPANISGATVVLCMRLLELKGRDLFPQDRPN